MNNKKQSFVWAANSSPAVESAEDSALDLLQAELSEEKDRYRRLAEDIDNFRKRSARENVRRTAVQKEALIRDLLPVVDNLERALAVKAKTSFEQLHEGVDMTLRQLRQLLSQNGVDLEESQGEPFDPLRHDAIGSRNDPTKPHNTVLEVAQSGYRRGAAIFRPAKVIVNEHGE